MKFRSVFTGTNYVPPSLDSDVVATPKHTAQSPMRIRPFTATPIPEPVIS